MPYEQEAVHCKHTHGTPLKLRRPEQRAVHSSTLIVLFRDPKVRKAGRHDPSRRASRDNGILREIIDAFVLPQEILVKNALPIDVLCWCLQYG